MDIKMKQEERVKRIIDLHLSVSLSEERYLIDKFSHIDTSEMDEMDIYDMAHELLDRREQERFL